MAIGEANVGSSHTGASGLESPTTSTIGIASKLLFGLDWVLLVVPWLKDGDISLVSILAIVNVTLLSIDVDKGLDKG